MPSLVLTSCRKFSTITSAFAASRINTSRSLGSFCLSVIARLLLGTFSKSAPLRGAPGDYSIRGSGWFWGQRRGRVTGDRRREIAVWVGAACGSQFLTKTPDRQLKIKIGKCREPEGDGQQCDGGPNIDCIRDRRF